MFQIDLVGPPTINMKPVLGTLDSDFCKEYEGVVELKNNGNSTVPLKLTLAAVSSVIILNPKCFVNDGLWHYILLSYDLPLDSR